MIRAHNIRSDIDNTAKIIYWCFMTDHECTRETCPRRKQIEKMIEEIP